MALLVSALALTSAAACKKTGEGEYQVKYPELKTDSATVRTPTVDVVKDTTAVVVPKVQMKKDTTHMAVPKVRIKKP
jgi:hypothetical protein